MPRRYGWSGKISTVSQPCGDLSKDSHDLTASAAEERIIPDNERTSSALGERCECHIKIAFGRRAQNEQLQTEPPPASPTAVRAPRAAMPPRRQAA
jgi:hypothetical protein